MNILETYFTYAKLSQAAYIDLSSALSPLDGAEIADVARIQERVPEALGKNIFGVGVPNADTWTMLSPCYKTGGITGHSDPTSGFAGMLLSNPETQKVPESISF